MSRGGGKLGEVPAYPSGRESNVSQPREAQRNQWNLNRDKGFQKRGGEGGRRGIKKEERGGRMLGVEIVKCWLVWALLGWLSFFHPGVFVPQTAPRVKGAGNAARCSIPGHPITL